MTNTSLSRNHWVVGNVAISERGYRGEAVLKPIGTEFRFYPLFESTVQLEMLSEFILVSTHTEALRFTKEWGFLVEPGQGLPVNYMLDAAASVRRICEILDQMQNNHSQDYWIRVEGDLMKFDRTHAPATGIKKRSGLFGQIGGPAVLVGFKRSAKDGFVVGEYMWAEDEFAKPAKSTKESIKVAAGNVVSEWITAMLEPVRSSIRYKNNSFVFETQIENPWAAIAHQLSLKALGGSSSGTCAALDCLKTFVRQRSTKIYCSDPCEQRARRRKKRGT